MVNHEESIPAEIEAAPGKSRQAASALQERGFRVLHVGSTISISGSADLWQRVFGLSFAPVAKETYPGRTTWYQRPRSTEPIIPEDMGDLIKGVYFVEPPELH